MSIILTLDNYICPPICQVKKIFELIRNSKGGGVWKIGNEIKPVDLYCYLYIKYGSPNGIQNILRADDSNNLIHWDWTLVNNDKIIMLWGLNLKTEIHISGVEIKDYDKDQFIRYIRAEIEIHKKEISRLKKKLEKWILFINPYIAIKRSFSEIYDKFKALKLSPLEDQIDKSFPHTHNNDWANKWNKVGKKYSLGTGLSLSLKIMLPIIAESFINLIIYILCKPEIKSDKELYNSYVRSRIDLRIKSLNNNCRGFAKKIRWDSEQSKEYNKIINQRNDLLHGNIDIKKLKITNIYFNGKVPIFEQYYNMWEQSLGVGIRYTGLDTLEKDYKVVMDFIEYILSCLEDDYRKQVEELINKSDLGYNKENGRLGILLPDHIVDIRARMFH